MIFSFIISLCTLYNFILCGAVYFILVYIFKIRTPATTTFYHADTDRNWFLRESLESSPKYEPPFLLKNGVFQSFAVGFVVNPDVPVDREYVELADGGVVGLDWVKPCSDLPESAPVLIILFGMTGEVRFVSGVAREACKRNYRVVFFNKRGHNGTILKTPKLQAFCDTSDLRQCTEMINRRYPSAKMAAMGHSGGCALLTRYLSDYAGTSLISVCVHVSSGYNLIQLCLSVSWLYDRFLAYCLKQAVIEPNRGILSSVIDMKALDKSTTYPEFDYHVYCNMHGYRDVAEYWTNNNPMKDIEKVDVPVLCINSDDDPICLASNIPYDLFKRPNWMLINTNMGGHFFIDGHRDLWADLRALDYIEAVWKYETKEK